MTFQVDMWNNNHSLITYRNWTHFERCYFGAPVNSERIGTHKHWLNMANCFTVLCIIPKFQADIWNPYRATTVTSFGTDGRTDGRTHDMTTIPIGAMVKTRVTVRAGFLFRTHTHIDISLIIITDTELSCYRNSNHEFHQKYKITFPFQWCIDTILNTQQLCPFFSKVARLVLKRVIGLLKSTKVFEFIPEGTINSLRPSDAYMRH